MAGAGLKAPTGSLCSAGANIAWNGVALSNGAPLLPLRIIDGGAGPDMIQIVRSDSDAGAAPTRLVANMATPNAQLSVDGNLGLRIGDLMLVGATDRPARCTLMQLTAAPAANGSGWLLTHGAGVGNYNPADPAAIFSTAVAYEVRDTVVNLGNYGVRRYGLLCNNGAAPAATNNCDLAFWNALAPAAPTLATATSVSPDIIELQAQYGVSDTAADPTVTAWVDATGGWANPTLADSGRIKAVRLAIVARGNREGQTGAAPASVVLWGEGTPGERTRAFTTAERRYRYQVLSVVIPLINSLWTGT
jgi:type IV pilus assembly protein PilW